MMRPEVTKKTKVVERKVKIQRWIHGMERIWKPCNPKGYGNYCRLQSMKNEAATCFLIFGHFMLLPSWEIILFCPEEELSCSHPKLFIQSKRNFPIRIASNQSPSDSVCLVSSQFEKLIANIAKMQKPNWALYPMKFLVCTRIDVAASPRRWSLWVRTLQRILKGEVWDQIYVCRIAPWMLKMIASLRWLPAAGEDRRRPTSPMMLILIWFDEGKWPL